MFSAIALALLLSSTVSPEEQAQADKLVREGAEFGQQGNYRQAIIYFKSAEEIAPRATHYCNIGLAYALWKRYPEALYFLERCQGQAGEELPGWVEDRIKKTEKFLRDGRYAPVEIKVEPIDGSLIKFDALTEEEVFHTPLKIWLPLGKVKATIQASGFKVLERELYLESTKTQHFQFILEIDVQVNSPFSVVAPTMVPEPEVQQEAPARTAEDSLPAQETPYLETPEQQAPVLAAEDDSSMGGGKVSALLVAALSGGVGLWYGVEAYQHKADAAKKSAGAASQAAKSSKDAARRADLAVAIGLTGVGFYFVLNF